MCSGQFRLTDYCCFGAGSSLVIEHDVVWGGVEGGLPEQAIVQGSCTMSQTQQ